MNNISSFKRFFYGILIGIAAVTPGISGGVLAASYGIYEPSLSAVVNFRKRPKESFSWLFPIGIGVLSGVFIFARLMINLFENNNKTIMIIFCGLVIGGIPLLIRESKGKIRKSHYLILFSLVFFSGVYLSEYIGGVDTNSLPQIIRYIIIGFIVSAGTVIPGISSSFILIKLNFYESYMACLGGENILNGIIIFISFVLTSFCLFKFISILFEKIRGYAYCAVCGFLSSSVIAVFPELSVSDNLGAYILLLAVSIFIGYFIVREK